MAGIKFQCVSCGQHLEAPIEAADCALACPQCAAQLRVPSAAAVMNCAICQSPFQSGEPTANCPTCQAVYHADCWQENGGCAIYGCAEVPKVEQRRAIEIPISYWGQENKPCPNCGRQILAAAVRCRHCGVTFASARPEDAAEFQDRTALESRLPGMKRVVIWIFVFSVTPCFAPIGAMWGLIWFLANRRSLGALPAVYAALCKIGLVVALGQCLLILIMAALYSATRAH